MFHNINSTSRCIYFAQCRCGIDCHGILDFILELNPCSEIFVLRLNIPVNNFSVMSGWSHRFLGITSTFRE